MIASALHPRRQKSRQRVLLAQSSLFNSHRIYLTGLVCGKQLAQMNRGSYPFYCDLCGEGSLYQSWYDNHKKSRGHKRAVELHQLMQEQASASASAFASAGSQPSGGDAVSSASKRPREPDHATGVGNESGNLVQLSPTVIP